MNRLHFKDDVWKFIIPVCIRCLSGKRDVSGADNSTRDIDGDDDYYNDGRDRRAIDEEDDEDFFQELHRLADEVKWEYTNLMFR